ncbi:hypothetical protein AB0299_21735 [Pseudarthrobacter sp. NPDC080037]|uniref:hypothetical protein n=1 Tax=Pseudarthrobacter sp. NPDC080037 TaxID=3155289 RepID=UPI00344CA538
MTANSTASSVPVVGKSGYLPAALTEVILAPNAQISLTVAVLRAASFAIAAALTERNGPDKAANLQTRRNPDGFK